MCERIVKFLEVNMGENLCESELSKNFLDMISKVWFIEEVDKFDFKIKNCSVTYEKINSQSTN
jgi:hypothetical protein